MFLGNACTSWNAIFVWPFSNSQEYEVNKLTLLIAVTGLILKVCCVMLKVL